MEAEGDVEEGQRRDDQQEEEYGDDQLAREDDVGDEVEREEFPEGEDEVDEEEGNGTAPISLDEPFGFEYLDHTADIHCMARLAVGRLHSWGPDLKTALEQVVVAMFGYMTNLDEVELDDEARSFIEVEGHDLPSLLFNLMDEFLFRFSADYIIFKDVKITKMDLSQRPFRIHAEGYGEQFDLNKHVQGTEVKAITYSAMQMCTDVATAPSDEDSKALADIVRPLRIPGRHELWVIVDI